jgi:hypothetical protein
MICPICGMHEVIAAPFGGTVTGRFTCRTPNTALSFPRSERHEIPREAVFISTDYAAIERRLAAGLGDSWMEKLRELADMGVDVHTRTAAFVFEVPEAEVTSEMRARAKIINFGALYSSPATRARDREHYAKTAESLRAAGLGGYEIPKTWREALHGAGVQSPTDDFLAQHPVACRCQICSGAYREKGPPASSDASRTTDPTEDGSLDAQTVLGRPAAISVPSSRTCSGGRLDVVWGSRIGTRPVMRPRPLYCPICGRHRTVSMDLRRFLHTGTVKRRPCMRAHRGPQHRVGRPR